MTPEELRRWSAETLMQWQTSPVFNDWWGVPVDPNHPKFQEGAFAHEILKEDWKPDLPATGQIWLVVEGIKKMDCRLELWTLDDDRYHAIIWKFKNEPYPASQTRDTNPCLAILKAAYAAIESTAPNSP